VLASARCGRCRSARFLFLLLVCLTLPLDAAVAQSQSTPQPPAAQDKQTDPDDVPRVEEHVIVTATRTDSLLEDQPVRVEVIDREEIEEKALMTPGSVAMLIGETTGLRVQTTAPSLGSANVRIQGLRGRYSQLIADGLPLYGAKGDSLSLLQVPPLDLGQVEIIKGVASALYGTAALGGVINLVSRRPQQTEQQMLFNLTSQTGRDATLWLAGVPGNGWSWSLLGGYHGQGRSDLDHDGWSDLPSVERGTVRPRVFYDDGKGRTLLATAGVMFEDRAGGSMPGHTAPDGAPFPEELDTGRVDAGLVARWLTGNGLIAAVRGSFMRSSQDRTFGEAAEDERDLTWFSEASLQGAHGRQVWVVGGAIQQDRFRSPTLPQFDYDFWSPSLFAQDEISFGRKWALAISARGDAHSEYGLLAAPRVSLLSRPTPAWTIRVAAGTGAFAPTPFTEETEETGLSFLLPLRGLVAERARTASADVTWRAGPFDVTATGFGSTVSHPVLLRHVGDDQVQLVNMPEPTRTWGTELLGRYRRGPFMLMVTHAWTESTEIDPDEGIRREVPLTPRNTASFDAMWEDRGHGRIGFEWYYVGQQHLDENPYRDRSPGYTLFGVLAERRFGPVHLFVNSENLGNVRQTKFDPLVRPTREPGGGWTVDAWAPLDGRVINGGVRVVF